MKEGLADKRHPDPHSWKAVTFDLIVHGSPDVILRSWPGWVCSLCKRWAELPSERWNPYYPDLYPCATPLPETPLPPLRSQKGEGSEKVIVCRS